MSEIQEIDVFVRPDGTVKIEVRGVKGEQCLPLTAALEALLGGTVVERVHTDEFHEVPQSIDITDQLEQRSR
jgi:hypothetical protein